MQGGFDHDRLSGGTGTDTLDGDAGNDTLIGHQPGQVDVAQDFLNGGAGDDLLIVGNGDLASGNSGADTFRLGDWLEEGDGARIMDFDPTTDGIEIQYDPTAHPNPVVDLRLDDSTGDMQVRLDGMPLVLVQNGAGLTLEAIRLSAA
ncbi:hypothetical protein ACFSHQ_07915 [Gemmobacter lanyuensis]